uniref:Protein kinase domain-containing protein n=1 Tax=Cynoglossus semilaevis TaxID=244447 RepID=A0A3P8WC81_CYNSE
MNSCGYRVDKLLGRGGFGFVYQCIRSDSDELVALKIIHSKNSGIGVQEVRNLEQIRELDPEMNNFIRLNRHFELDGHIFLEFEKLDINVDNLVERHGSLHLADIQVITQQVVVALEALNSIRMVHADIKPENIMLVDQKQKPYKIKLIDFGIACHVSKLKCGDIIHILEYQAPEVSLGIPVNEAIDMWALGCVVAFMYISEDLYTGSCELGKMEEVVCTLQSTSKTPVHQPVRDVTAKQFTSLDDILLHIDPSKRIKPREALKHPFMTWKRFPSDLIFESSARKKKLPQTEDNAAPVDKKSPQSTTKNVISSSVFTAADIAKASSEDATPTEPSSASTGYVSVVDHSDTDEESAGWTNIKPKKIYFKRISRFLTHLFKRGEPCCESPGDDETTASTSKLQPHPASITSRQQSKIPSNGIPAVETSLTTDKTPSLTGVRTKKTYFKRLSGFFSQLCKKRTASSCVKKPTSRATINIISSGPFPTESLATVAGSASYGSAGDKIGAEEEATDYTEVKTKRKYLKRMSRFLSPLIKTITCCRKDKIEVKCCKTSSPANQPDVTESLVDI